MKKIIKENKIYIFIGLLVVVFGVLIFWPQKKVEEKVSTKTIKMAKPIGIRQQAEAVEWGTTKIEVPEKIATLKATNSFINGDKLDILFKALGMTDPKVTKSDDYYVIYKSGKSVLYIKLKEKQIDYQIGEKMTYTGEKDPAKAFANFKTLINSITKREVEEPTVEYFKDEYRAVRSTISSADYLEVSTNFVFNKIPIISYQGGPSIKAQYNFEGKLGRLMIFNPFDELKSENEVKTITVDEVRQMPANSLPIFGVKGNKEYTMSTGEETINMINTDNTQLVYVFEPATSKYLPYLRVSGTSKLESGETEIIFGVPLIKQ